MLHTHSINRTLEFLDREYRRHIVSSEARVPLIFSKLGVIELGGWVEESFDEIARQCVRRRLRTSRSRDVLEEKIRKTHGFKYEKHSREMLAVAMGAVRLLRIENQLDRDGSLALLKSELNSLYRQRNQAAHTYTRGTTVVFDSPSVTIERFRRMEPILRRLWEAGSEI